MHCSPPGSSVHGISQARILKCLVFFFFKGSFQPRDQTHGYCIGRRILYHWATWEGQFCSPTFKIQVSPVLTIPSSQAESDTSEILKTCLLVLIMLYCKSWESELLESKKHPFSLWPQQKTFPNTAKVFHSWLFNEWMNAWFSLKIFLSATPQKVYYRLSRCREGKLFLYPSRFFWLAY